MRKVGTTLLLVAVLALAYYLNAEQQPAEDATAPVVAETPGVEDISSINLVTWNVLNLGKSKNEEEIAFIADQVRDFDLVVLQEVVTSPEGAQAVARLDDELDRRGAGWDYVLSDPTSGEGSERYAFLWKPSRVRLVGTPWLEASLADPIDREPFMARFAAGQSNRQILIASFHAVPTAKRPADEIAFLDALHAQYPDDHLLIMGDFNLSQQHQAFDELKTMGFAPVLVDQRTSLRMRRRDGEHLANEYDNIFFEAATLRPGASGVLDFTGQFRTLRQARMISDHLPVYMEVHWR